MVIRKNLPESYETWPLWSVFNSRRNGTKGAAPFCPAAATPTIIFLTPVVVVAVAARKSALQGLLIALLENLFNDLIQIWKVWHYKSTYHLIFADFHWQSLYCERVLYDKSSFNFYCLDIILVSWNIGASGYRTDRYRSKLPSPTNTSY